MFPTHSDTPDAYAGNNKQKKIVFPYFFVPLQAMKWNWILICFALLCSHTAWGSAFSKLLKNPDNELKYKAALTYYADKQYSKTITLLESVATSYRGTETSENILYLLSDCYMRKKDYVSAAHYLKSYVSTYIQHPHHAECLYQLAYCYYLDSPEPELDQTSTNKAIESFQQFIVQYPGNEQVTQAKEYITELYAKLSKRELLNARLYYNLGNYKGNNYRAAVVTSLNAMNDYPDSPYLEEFAYIIVRSKYKEAVGSVQEKIHTRCADAADECYYFLQEYPQSEHRKEITRLASQLNRIVNNSKDYTIN